MLLIGALPFQGVLLIGVVDLYISFDKRFSEIPLSPIRPEGAEALRLWYAVREKPCPLYDLKGQMLFVYDMRKR